jgi:hypothetical protein
MLGHAERTEHDVARRERSGDRHHRQRQTRLLLGHPSEPSRKILENGHHLRCTNLCVPLWTQTPVLGWLPPPVSHRLPNAVSYGVVLCRTLAGPGFTKPAEFRGSRVNDRPL